MCFSRESVTTCFGKDGMKAVTGSSLKTKQILLFRCASYKLDDIHVLLQDGRMDNDFTPSSSSSASTFPPVCRLEVRIK